MAAEIIAISIELEASPILISISTRELIAGDQYEYTSKTVSLSDVDNTAILAIVTPYLSH